MSSSALWKQQSGPKGVPLTTRNFQEFCRICLKRLKNATEANERNNVFLLPHLARLVVLLQTLHNDSKDAGPPLIEEETFSFPKSLCEICYDQLLMIERFRDLAAKSLEVLQSIVRADKEAKAAPSEFREALPKILPTTEPAIVDLVDMVEPKAEPESDDNQLLLPEILPFEEKPLNPVLEDETTTEPARNYDLTKYEDTGLGAEKLADSYSQNSYNSDSPGDEADDEEYSLPSGAANASSKGLNVPPTRHRNGNQTKAMRCPICKKLLYKKNLLEAHIRGVHEGCAKPFKCDMCQEDFTRYNQLHTHKQTHKKVFNCQVADCDDKFKVKTNLELHLRVVHGENQPPTVDQDEYLRNIEADNICETCFKKYSSKRALVEHRKRHLAVREHVCEVCGVAKVTRTELQTHMRTHETNLEKYNCTICPQMFTHKNAVNRHIRVVHQGDRRYPCKYCEKRFGTHNSKVCHERLHTGERPYCCHVCQKKFAQLGSLRSHHLTHDLLLRKHVCPHCSRRFITRKNLADHEQRHRGDKPHICEICNKGFAKKRELKQHKPKHEELPAEETAIDGDDRGSL